jgi:CRP/FNR family transcriptional regulator
VKFGPSPPSQAASLSVASPRAAGRLRCDTCPGRNIGICKPLDDARLVQLLALGNVRRWSKGQTMFVAGEPMAMFYKVTSGLVAIFRGLEDGRRQIVGIHTIGDLCGYLEDDGGYHFSGEAITDVEACAFDRRRFDSFAARHGDLANALASDMSAKLKRTGESMAVIGQLKAPEKVAYFLLQLGNLYAERLGRSASPLELGLTRRQIADYLGLTLETVSRAFSRLKSAGLVALIGADKVAILDRKALASYAGLATYERR